MQFPILKHDPYCFDYISMQTLCECREPRVRNVDILTLSTCRIYLCFSGLEAQTRWTISVCMQIQGTQTWASPHTGTISALESQTFTGMEECMSKYGLQCTLTIPPLKNHLIENPPFYFRCMKIPLLFCTEGMIIPLF